MMPAKAVCRRVVDAATSGEAGDPLVATDLAMQEETFWKTERATWDACSRKPYWAVCRALEEVE